MPAEFFLKTLGIPRLTTSVGHDIRIRVRKHLAVLVVLAVEGGKVRRERLVSMLWPTSRPDRARGSLATAISFLRGKLGGDAIEPGRDYVQLKPGLVGLDLHRLERCEIIGDDFTPTLEVDGFLNGFELESLPEFEAWRDRQHARLLPSIEKALVTLTDNARRSGDLSGLAKFADKLLELNDLSEWGIKAQMEAYALSGDRITALRVYDEWVDRLRRELDATPTRVVEDIASRLRRRSLDPAIAEPRTPVVRTEQWQDRFFVGRGKEYRRLYSIWENVKAGHPACVILKGDSGIGKTTLADRFATGLALEGLSVARVRCFDLEQQIPYAMISATLEGLLERPGIRATNPGSLAELAKILPEITRKFPTLPPSPTALGDAAPLHLAEAALDLITSLLEETPLLIVVDDFDRSDEASMGILHYIYRRHRTTQLMIVLTARNGAVRLGNDSAPWMTWTSLPTDTVEIEPLSEEESSALFDFLVRDSDLRPTNTERRLILTAAAGFPLALELLVRDWQVHGTRSIAMAFHAMTSEVHANPEAKYQQLTESLFSDFPEPERVVVNVAAVLDRRVGDLELYNVAGVGQASLLAALSRMVERRVLRDGPKGLEWINPSVRAHAYLRIPHSLRRALHESIAEELLRRDGLGLTIPRLEIAWHCMRAGRTEEASRFLVSGARDALMHGSPHDAELALSTGLPFIQAELVDEAVYTLAEAMLDLNRPGEAIIALGRLQSSASTPSANLFALQAKTRLGALTPGERQRGLESIVEILRNGCPPLLAARALTSATSMMSDYQHDYCEEILEASDRIDGERLDLPDRLSLWVTKAKLHFLSRHTDRAGLLLHQAKEAADAAGIRNGCYLVLLNGLGVCAGSRGNYEESISWAERFYCEASKSGDSIRAASAASNAALCSFRLGAYRAVSAWVDRAQPLAGADPVDALNLMWALGLASAYLKDHKTSRQAAQALGNLGATAILPTVRRSALCAAADVWFAIGHKAEATTIARQALPGVIPLDNFGSLGRFARWKAHTSIGSDLDGAASELRSLLKCPLDTIDRAEVFTGLTAIGRIAENEKMTLSRILELLPAPVGEHLAFLGLP